MRSKDVRSSITLKRDVQVMISFQCVRLKLAYPIHMNKTHYNLIQENILLTIVLLEPKMISVFHQYRAIQACTSVQHGKALYCWLIIFKVLIFISRK